ncbi:MAG: hypothetical protein ACOC2C_03745 [Cyclonatronaceae bacterium]
MKTQSTFPDFMTSFKRYQHGLILALLAVLLSFTATDAEAQGNGGMLFPSLFGEEMQLSDAQKREIAEIRVAAMMERREQRSEMRGNRENQGQRGQMQRGNRQNGGQMMAGRNAFQSEILAVLTPEQRSRLEEMQNTRQAEREEMQQYMIQARAGYMAEELDFNEAQTQELEDIMMNHHGEMKAAREQGRPSEAVREAHREALHTKIEEAFGSQVYQRWAELFQPGRPRGNRR